MSLEVAVLELVLTQPHAYVRQAYPPVEDCCCYLVLLESALENLFLVALVAFVLVDCV
jgi:hypothetical protein